MSHETANDGTGGTPSHVPKELVVDFDFRTDERFMIDPQQGLADFVRYPELFWTPRNGGHWVAASAKAVRAIFSDAHTFSNAISSIPSTLEGRGFKLIPENLDPPDHEVYRKLLNPYFSRSSVNALAGIIRSEVIKLIDNLAPIGKAEFVSDMAAVMPVEVFMRYMGFPVDRRAEFVQWMYLVFHSVDPAERVKVFADISTFIRDIVAARRSIPRDDFISHLIGETVRDRPITDEELFGILVTMFLAGIETVGTALAFMMRSLALDSSLQRQLRDTPKLIPAALTEMMRRFGIVNLARTATRDCRVLGVDIRKGDPVWVPSGASGMDSREYNNPCEIDFDRKNNNRHTSFGFGMHHCLGLHLANLEMGIFLEEWFARVPEFHISEGATTRTESGQGFTLSELRLAWTVSNR
jgi:cytochrome P450